MKSSKKGVLRPSKRKPCLRTTIYKHKNRLHIFTLKNVPFEKRANLANPKLAHTFTNKVSFTQSSGNKIKGYKENSRGGNV
jgi:hypothetical protein